MKGLKSPREKSSFLDKFCKDQEVKQQGSGGYTTRIRRLYNKDQDVISWIFLVFVLLSASVERCFVSSVRDFVLNLVQKHDQDSNKGANYKKTSQELRITALRVVGCQGVKVFFTKKMSL